MSTFTETNTYCDTCYYNTHDISKERCNSCLTVETLFPEYKKFVCEKCLSCKFKAGDWMDYEECESCNDGDQWKNEIEDTGKSS